MASATRNIICRGDPPHCVVPASASFPRPPGALRRDGEARRREPRPRPEGEGATALPGAARAARARGRGCGGARVPRSLGLAAWSRSLGGAAVPAPAPRGAAPRCRSLPAPAGRARGVPEKICGSVRDFSRPPGRDTSSGDLDGAGAVVSARAISLPRQRDRVAHARQASERYLRHQGASR